MHVTLSHCPSEYQIKVLFPEHEIGSKAVNIVWLQILVGVVLSKYISFGLTGHAHTSQIKLTGLQGTRGTQSFYYCTILLPQLFYPRCHFPQGLRFKQWMGDNSKALIYVSAIKGHVSAWIAISGFTGVVWVLWVIWLV